MQNEEPQIDEELSVSYVLLDVSAINQKGEPVDDLSVSDFVVTDHKKKVEITYFEKLDFRTSPKVPGAEDALATEDKAESPALQIIIVLELEDLNLFDLKKGLEGLEQFLRDLDSQTRYAIEIFSMETGSITKGFIEDPKVVLDIFQVYKTHYLERYMASQRPRSQSESLLPDHDDSDFGGSASQRRRNPAALGGRRQKGNVLSDLENDLLSCTSDDCISMVFDDFIDHQRRRSERLLKELEDLTFSYREKEGLKLMFLLSPGFVLGSIQTAHDMLAGVLGSGSRFLHNPMLDDLPDPESSRKLIHACIRNRVIFHTFDPFNRDAVSESIAPGGRRISGDTRTRLFRQWTGDVDRSLRIMARDSGGSFSSGKLNDSMETAIQGSRFFYVIGYNSPPGKPGKFRKISVKSSRKGVELLYRNGYFGSQASLRSGTGLKRE